MIQFNYLENLTRPYMETMKNRESQKPNETMIPFYCIIQEQNILNQIAFKLKCKRRISQVPSYLLLENNSINNKQAKSALINYFLDESVLDWDLLEIKGSKGSGKKTLAMLVEEYVWKYSKNPQIPIMVDTKSSGQQNINLDFILKQPPYSFNSNQIQELKQDVRNQQLQLVLIILTCQREGENDVIIKLHHNLVQEWINYKMIKFIDSSILPFKKRNCVTVEMQQFSDNQIEDYFAKVSRNYVHQSLLQLYLDLKLDQTKLEEFRKQQLSFLQIKAKSICTMQDYDEVDKIITDIKFKAKSQHDLIEKVKYNIQQFLRVKGIIEKCKVLDIEQLLKKPYSLYLVSKFYHKLYDENMQTTNSEWFQRIFELYYFYENFFKIN